MKTADMIYWLDRLIDMHLGTYPAEYREAVQQAIDMAKRTEGCTSPAPHRAIVDFPPVSLEDESA